MTKTIRRWLFVIFCCLFVIISAAVLFYAFGYNFSPYGWKLEKTGFLQIKTKPEGAAVFIDGQAYTGLWRWPANNQKPINTPAKISNLKPGYYDLTLSLAGYHPWNKRIEIKSGETTYLENVRFFRNESPALLNTVSAKAVIAWSDDGKLSALLDQKILTVIDHKTEQTLFQQTVNDYGTESYVNWSPDNSRLAVNGQIIKLSEPQSPIKLADAASHLFVDFSGYQTVYYLNDNQLFKYDYGSNRLSGLTAKRSDNYQAHDWLIKGGYIHLLEQHDLNRDWRISVFKNNGQFLGSISLPIISDLKFINRENDWLNILDTKNHKLYIAASGYQSSGAVFKTLERVEQAHWLNNKLLLLSGDSELRLWSTGDDQEKLLTRVSRPLINALWHNDDNYIIYATDSGIQSLELDDRGGHHETKLTDGNTISHLSLSFNGQKLFFLGQINQQSGLYSLRLY